MSKRNGRQGPDGYDPHHHPGHHRGGLLPQLTPANVIGMALFLFFTSQLFTTSPFEGLTRSSGTTGDIAEGRVWRGTFIKVSAKSHAYLQKAFWDRTPDSFVANVSRLYEPQDAAARQKLAGEQSHFAEWIEKDLAPWQGGITKDLLEDAANMYDVCDGDMLRFQVINGSLWVHHITDRRNGWYPAVLGPGNVAAKGRIPYALLAIMDTLRLFPGQVPDVDAVLHTADFPCIKRSWAHGSATPLPMLGYQASVRHFDIPFPDYTHWGHEHMYIQDPWGNPAHGWGNQAEVLSRKYANISLLDRVPQAMWRGRTKDKIYPHRDHLRRRFVECVDTLKATGRHDDAALISVLKPPVALQDSCDYRLNMYIESDSYASNLKQKLVCGSVLVALRMEYFEWYARGLEAGKHYVELTNEEDHVCEQTVAAARDMNAMLDSRGRSQLDGSDELTPTLTKQLAAMRADRRLAKLLKPPGSGGGDSGAVKEPAPGAGGNFTWGSALMPWEIAANGQQFVQDHVRMQDALLYIRDLLRAYAKLQQFKVRPLAKATCYTGDRLLEQFATPHSRDGKAVARAYPWLTGYDAGCKEAEATWGDF